MRLEATLKPVTYRWPHGAITLTPGQPVEVEAERGGKILEKCGDKVRIIGSDTPKPLPVEVGSLVSWDSGLGPCEGRVDGTHQDDDGQRWVDVTLTNGNWASVDVKQVTVLAGPDEQ